LSDRPPGPKRHGEDAAQGGFADNDHAAATGWLSRILWFVGLWAASVAVLGAVAYAIRALLR
jgi:hypothetical protein